LALGAVVLVLSGFAASSPAAENPVPPPGGTPMNGVDFTGMTPQQVTLATEILNGNRCNCGCGMTLAECRVKDPHCGKSLPLAQQVVQDVKAGKDRATVQSNLAASMAKLAAAAPAPAPGAQEDLNKVYKIDVLGSPSKGAKTAKVTIVEFSDYQ
jgi:hypothetical protein